MLKVRCALVLAVFFLAGPVFGPHPAWAHRANVFAFVEDGTVRVECSFGRGAPIRRGRVDALDAITGEALAGGLTDDSGLLSFPVPEKARLAAHGLLLRVNAGEGHLGEWLIEPEELKAGPVVPGNAATVFPPSAPPYDSLPCISDLPDFFSLDGRELERRLGEALDRKLDERLGSGLEARLDASLDMRLNALLDEKLAPIRRALAEMSHPGPRDVIGGIGWLVGLAGLVVWFRRRPGLSDRSGRSGQSGQSGKS